MKKIMWYVGMIELFASKTHSWSGLKHQYEHTVFWKVLWKYSFKTYQRYQGDFDGTIHWNEQEESI